MPSIRTLRIFMEFCLLLSLQRSWSGSDSSTVSSLIFVVSSSFHFGRDREWNFCRNTDFSTLIHPFLVNILVVSIQRWKKGLRCFVQGWSHLQTLGYGAGDRGQDACALCAICSFLCQLDKQLSTTLCHQISLWNRKFKATFSVVEMGVRPSDWKSFLCPFLKVPSKTTGWETDSCSVWGSN